MILIKLAKNKNKTIKEAYGKYYARPVVTETIGIDELAELTIALYRYHA